MLELQKPEPAPLLNDFLTTMAQGGSQNYCGVCLRTENERRLVNHKALITFTECISLTRQWKNKFICYMCHRQALKALTFLRGVSFAGNMDTLFSDLLDQKKNLKEDIFQNSIFQALLIKHGMGGLKYSPESWETELRCIRRATTLKCRRTKVTGVGTGRPQQDRLSSGNLYLVHTESDAPSDPDSELALASTSTTTITNQNQSTSASENTDPPSSNHESRTLTPNQEEAPRTDSQNPDISTSLNPGLSKQINQSFACRKGACWTRKRRPISAAELAAARAPRVDLYESHYGRSNDEEISRTLQRLSTGQNRSNRVRRKSTLDEAMESSSRAVLTTVDEAGPSRIEHAGPSRVEYAGPSRVERAGPSRVERAGPSRVEHAGPSRVEYAGPSRVEQAGPSRVERAGPSRVERAGPSRVEKAGHSRVERAGPSRVEKAGPSRVEKAGPSRVERAGPSRVEHAGPSRVEKTGPSRVERAGPSRVEKAGPSRVEKAGPSRVERAGPSRVEKAGPSRAEQPGPSRVERAGPSRVEQAGPSRLEQAGPSRVEQARPSRVEQAGPSRVEKAGPSRVEQAGPSRVEQAGPSCVEQVGLSRVEQAGPSRVEPAGPSREKQAGPSQASEAGPSWASKAGPSWASEAGPSWASEAGPSWAYKAGPNWFYEAGPSWAYDVCQSWTSQAGLSRVYEAQHTSTDSAGTSCMDQSGARPISSKECRKDLGGTKRKGRRPVSKDHTTTGGAVDNIVIPPQPQSEKIVILDNDEEDNEIELQIEKLVATDVKPDPILSSTPTLTRQLNEPVNRALEHENVPSTSQKQIQVNTVYYVPENQFGENNYSGIIITDNSSTNSPQNNSSSNRPLTLPAPSQSKSGQSGPNRKRSLDGVLTMATPSKRTVMTDRAGRRVDWEDKIASGVISYKSTAGPSSNPQMPPPTSRYVIKTPASGRVQEPPRINTGRGEVLSSAQHSSTRNPSPQMTPAAAQKSYVRTTPPNVRLQGPPRTHRGGSEVFISAQAAVRINPNPDGPRTGRPAHGPLRRPRYVGRNQGQPAIQDVIRKYTMSNEDSE